VITVYYYKYLFETYIYVYNVTNIGLKLQQLSPVHSPVNSTLFTIDISFRVYKSNKISPLQNKIMIYVHTALNP